MDMFDLFEELIERMFTIFSGTRPVKMTASPPPTEEKKMSEETKPEVPATPAPFALTLEQMRKIMPLLPLAKATVYHPLIVAAMNEFEINTPKRAAAFLAQLSHESGQLRYFEEIASGAAYEGRKDLGNVIPGDGKRYKGRGPIQLTGRTNYRDYGKELGIDLENSPELAALPEIGFRTAGAFWKRKGLNPLADAGEFKTISIRINGINKKTGEPNGLADRIKYYTVAKEVLGVS